MKKILLVSLTVSLFFTCNPLQAAWYQTAYKAVERFWAPPAAPTITNMTLAGALLEHQIFQKQTNYWFLPTRSCLAGATTASAAFLLGKILKSQHIKGFLSTKPALAATAVGLVGAGASWLWLYLHKNIRERQYNQRTLKCTHEMLGDPELVLTQHDMLSWPYRQTLDRWLGEYEQQYNVSLKDQSVQPAPDEQKKIDRAYSLLRQFYLDYADAHMKYTLIDCKPVPTPSALNYLENIAEIRKQCLSEGIDESIFKKAFLHYQKISNPMEKDQWAGNSIKNRIDLHLYMIRLKKALQHEADPAAYPSFARN